MELSLKRASPIGAVARDYLVELVKQEDVLHNKNTDGRMVLLKRQAWARVAAKFNAGGYGTKKTEQQLMKIWERIKAKVIQQHAQHKREVQRTGGGVPPPALPEETEKILSVISSEVKDLDSEFDSDAYSFPSEISTSVSQFKVVLCQTVVSANELRRMADVRCTTASAVMLPTLDLSGSVAGSSTTLLAAEEPQSVVLQIDSVDDPQPYRDSAVQEHSVVMASTPSTSRQNRRQPGYRMRKFADSQPSADLVNRNKEQLAVLAEQLKVAQLQQQAEQLRIELLKEQLKKAQLEVIEKIEKDAIRKKHLESEDVKVKLLQEQLQKARLENANLQ